MFLQLIVCVNTGWLNVLDAMASDVQLLSVQCRLLFSCHLWYIA